MSWLIGGTQSSNKLKLTGVDVTTSVIGVAIPIVYGTNVLGGNYIWYGDFATTTAQPIGSSSSSSGKGGSSGGGSGKSGGGGKGDVPSNTNYTASFLVALCEGPVAGINAIYMNQSVYQVDDTSLHMTFIPGNVAQSPWTHLLSNEPTDQQIGYSGICLIGSENFNLGGSASQPGMRFVVQGIGPFATENDCNPGDVIIDLLTNGQYGIGFPSAILAPLSGSSSPYWNYCAGASLFISPVYDHQQSGESILTDLATFTNSAWAWVNGLLTLVPYGDEPVGAYTPPSQPVYSLTDNDFMPISGGFGPVELDRARPCDAINYFIIEYQNQSNYYNPDTVEAKDLARIDLYGLRQSSTLSGHMFTNVNYAQNSAQLMLYRQAILNTYKFTLDQRYMLLDVMDIVAITDAALGLNQQWVRITQIEETDTGLQITAEEYLQGTGAAAEYSVSSGVGFSAAYNSAPDVANAPLFIEPPDQLGGQLEVLVGACSSGPNWGGCQVWVSVDGESYSLAGTIVAGARMGTLTAELPAITPTPMSPYTLDQTNTLSVDIAQDLDGILVSVSTQAADAFSTVCYVDGEYLAYANASLTGDGEYNLSYLVRGLYGTTPGNHNDGSIFCRIDSALLSFPFNQGMIGNTLSVKLLSFNLYGGGLQSLADVSAVTYTIQGTALKSPLPDVTDFRVLYDGGVATLDWDEITDFRPVLYEIRKGPSWATALPIGRFAHPPVSTQGQDTYWVAAYSQPVAGLIVYSEDPQSSLINVGVLQTNILATYDEQGTGWPGTLSSGAVINGPFVSTSASTDIIAITDIIVVADILNYGGQINGIYTIPSGHVIDVGTPTACQIVINWTGAGASIYDSFLSIADFLNTADFLDSGSTAFVEVYPEVAVGLASGAGSDIDTESSSYIETEGSSPLLTEGSIVWGPWQRFSSGTYYGQFFQARWQIKTNSPTIIAFLTSAQFGVYAPNRILTYTNESVASGGTTIVFPVPYNGGLNGSSLPNITASVIGGASGDNILITGKTKSQFTIQVLNGGSGVARTVDILVQGY